MITLRDFKMEDATWWIQEGSKEGFIRAVEYDGELVGCIGVNPGNFEYERAGEVGYWLCSSHWRKGIMRDALRQIIALTLDAGFRQEAILQRAIFKNGRFYDSHIFAILR